MYSFTPDKRRISHTNRSALPPLPVSDSEDYNGTLRIGRGPDDSINGSKLVPENRTRWTELEITGLYFFQIYISNVIKYYCTLNSSQKYFELYIFKKQDE